MVRRSKTERQVCGPILTVIVFQTRYIRLGGLLIQHLCNVPRKIWFLVKWYHPADGSQSGRQVDEKQRQSSADEIDNCMTKLPSHIAAGADGPVNEFHEVWRERDGRNCGTALLGVKE